eukprot:TRINITY_DN3005_c0_g1_i4.p1 TRINITY_DN3005_c0_g1~~TRINITY_DN3005_c0_g1_i4.p1  ORF type:complete len:184 (-),score=34.32 TRINITY_DN3005_c0_g1_i4:215-718(-)
MSGSWRFLFRVLFRQRKKLVFPVRNGILFGFIFLAGVVVSKKSLMYRQKFFEREGLTETEEIKKRVVLNGDGETFPLSGQFAQIHYTCWLLDGTEFDTTRSNSLAEFPYQVHIDGEEEIQGISEAVKTMTLGERSLFSIPYRLTFTTPSATNKDGVTYPSLTLFRCT